MIHDHLIIGAQEKKVAGIYVRAHQAPQCLMIDRQDYGHDNSPREIVALIVDRIADHGQKEVNLKTIKVQPCESDLFFTLKLSERSVNYLAPNDPDFNHG